MTNSKILSSIDREEETLNDKIKEISQVILDLQSFMDVSDVCLVSKYKSRKDQFRQMPPKHKISFQNLQLLQINRESSVNCLYSFPFHLLKQKNKTMLNNLKRRIPVAQTNHCGIRRFSSKNLTREINF